MTQKVVIPKGLVNPNETTIVEIPKNLQNVETVVARPRRKPTYHRRSFPRPSRGGPRDILHDMGTTWQGRPFDPDETPPPEKLAIAFPKTDRYMSQLSPGPVSYERGRGFHPVYSSTPRGMATSPDRSSRVRSPAPRRSPRSVSPGLTPDSTYSSIDPSESYYKSEVVTSSPEQVQTEITEEKSYYDYGDKSGSGEECPCTDESSGAYQHYGDDSSGGYQRFDSDYSPGEPSPAETSKLSQRDVMSSLGELESVELSQIMGDLSSFQNARRKLVFDASSLASAADFSVNLLGSATF